MKQKTKYVLLGIVVLFLGFAAVWRISGASLAGAVKQFILKAAENSINGSLAVGEVDFSFSGILIARQVTLKDSSGDLLASAQTLSLDLDLTDLLARRMDISRIRKVRVENLVLNIKRDNNSRWNATATLSKPSTEANTPSFIFRGQVVANNATVTVSTPQIHYEFKQVAGILNFVSYPDITMDLKSKSGSAEMAATGVWNFSGGGNVAINALGVDPATFSPTIPLKGPVTAAFVLTGTTDKPTAKGSFRIPAGRLGDTPFNEAIGNFSLTGATLSLSETQLNAFGGSITANGPVALDTLHYSQTISGQNIDSSQISEKDILGRLQFTANAKGQKSWENADADGDFSMGPGSVAGISFDALTGTFSKRGSYTRYYDLKAIIAGQTIYIGDAESINVVKSFFKGPDLPALPQPKVVPPLPKLPSLPRLF